MTLSEQLVFGKTSVFTQATFPKLKIYLKHKMVGWFYSMSNFAGLFNAKVFFQAIIWFLVTILKTNKS